MASFPPDDGATIRISFPHLSNSLKAILLGAFILGGVGGGWGLVGQAQQALNGPDKIAANLERIHQIELRLERLETRIEILSQLVAANYAVNTQEPGQKKLSKEIISKIQKDPLSVLADQD